LVTILLGACLGGSFLDTAAALNRLQIAHDASIIFKRLPDLDLGLSKDERMLVFNALEGQAKVVGPVVLDRLRTGHAAIKERMISVFGAGKVPDRFIAELFMAASLL